MKPRFASRTIFLIAASLLACTAASAQQESLAIDTAFFRQQKDTFQLWLDQAGFGKVLKLDSLNVDERRLSLCLTFACPAPDSAGMAWQAYKKDFEAHHYLGLEQQLFFKLVNLMEVWQSEADLQICSPGGPGREPHFLRAVYFKDGELKVASAEAEFRRELQTEEPGGKQ